MALIQYDLGPFKKRGSGHRHSCQDDPVRTQGEHGCLHTRREASGGPCPAHASILGISIWDQGTASVCHVSPTCGTALGQLEQTPRHRGTWVPGEVG